MSNLSSYHFVIKALKNHLVTPRELSRTMSAHPLSYMELPYDPEYALYNSRLIPEKFNSVTDNEMYWALRTNVILRHTGELPIEISGPDSEKLLNQIFTRDIGKVAPGRCSYQFACYHDGGMITDGILMRLSSDRFWMVQADGHLFSWYKAHADKLDVEISDPNVWVSQVQGPNSLKLLEAVIDEPISNFRYFDCIEISIAGENCWISRSGFSNELGWEIYFDPDSDIAAIGDHIVKIGVSFNLLLTGTPVFRARRIEAGLLNAGSDFDASTTPFTAGLGAFVEFDHRDFIGRTALEQSLKGCRTWGMRTFGGVALLGRKIIINGDIVGRICSSGYSPYQKCGVSIVRMDDLENGPGTKVEVTGIDGQQLKAEICELPMYDKERLIPRGKLVDIPKILE